MTNKDTLLEHTVCLIVVGDEILRGQVADTNTMYLARALRTAGVKLRRVIVVPDIVDEIVEVLRETTKSYTTVFTSGGVGPTHDDVTYEAVAKCLGLALQKNEQLVQLYGALLAKEKEAERLTIVPTPCEVVRVVSGMVRSFAVIKAGNVYSLPGSPKYFRPAVDTILQKFVGCCPLISDYVDVESKEMAIVKVLDELAKRWEGRVAIGSYPEAARQPPRTRITFESKSEEDVAAARRELLSSLAQFRIGAMSLTIERARRVIDSSRSKEHIKDALDTLEQCYDKYEPNEIFLSFNGGKDCTVVLYLAACVARLRGLPSLLCLYVTADSFPEVEDFVGDATRFYQLNLMRKEPPLRSALVSLLNERSDLKAGLMGVRKGDPGTNNLEPFAPTDPDWPSLMRVNPILSWTYNQVWDFILEHDVPYCSLYDQGYTSIGTRENTVRNPLLRDPNNPCLYQPAYTLRDDAAERQGRE